MEHRLTKLLYSLNSNKLFSDKIMVLLCKLLNPSFNRLKQAELVKTQQKLLLMFHYNYLKRKKSNKLMKDNLLQVL